MALIGSEEQVRDIGDVGAARDGRVEVREVSRTFGPVVALDECRSSSAPVRSTRSWGRTAPGKTTLLRVLTGPRGRRQPARPRRGLRSGPERRATLRARVGTVPSGDRSLYLRRPGLENLVFFARLQGLRRRDAARARDEVLRRSGSSDAARIAGRRLLARDAEAALGGAGAADSTRWCCSSTRRRTTSTPRRRDGSAASCGPGGTGYSGHLDDAARGRDPGLRGRRDAPRAGRYPLRGTVPELMAHALPTPVPAPLLEHARTVPRRTRHSPRPSPGSASIARDGRRRRPHFVLSLDDDAVLGDALAAVATRPASGCSPAATSAPRVEEAFLA